MIETTLKNMFDFQSFAKNSRIEAMMRSAESRCTSLSDEELSFVCAAGQSEPRNEDEE